MKKWLITLILSIFFISCGGTQNVKEESQEVKMIKYGFFDGYPNKTVGEGVESLVHEPKWESIVGADGKKYVNITGKINYQEKLVNMTLQYKVEDNRFELNALEFNGVPQIMLVYLGMINKMFEEEETDKKKVAQEKPKETFAYWKILDVLDEFGDKTDEKYVSSKVIKGTFSNSATKDSDLYVSIAFTRLGDSIVFLNEYNKNRTPVTFLGRGQLKAKNEKGELFNSKVTNWDEKKGGLKVVDKNLFTSFLSNSKTVKVNITNEYSSSYSFVISSEGMKETIEKLKK